VIQIFAPQNVSHYSHTILPINRPYKRIARGGLINIDLVSGVIFKIILMADTYELKNKIVAATLKNKALIISFWY
jgi:hypothetical protein